MDTKETSTAKPKTITRNDIASKNRAERRRFAKITKTPMLKGTTQPIKK